LLAGRDFNLADRAGSQAVAIVSKSLANSFWPGENPIGKKIMAMESRAAPESLMVIEWRLIRVTARCCRSLRRFCMFHLAQNYDSIARLMVSVKEDPSSFKGAFRHVIEQANPDLPNTDHRHNAGTSSALIVAAARGALATSPYLVCWD